MSKILTALLAGTAALALNATAAEQPKDGQGRDNQTQAQPNATKGKPEQRDAQSQQSGAQGQSTARDNTQQSQTPNQANQAGADEGNMGRKPDQPGGDVSAREREYLADIKKCDSLSGDQMRQCVDAAKKKHGQM
jgi:hypothetical protein